MEKMEFEIDFKELIRCTLGERAPKGWDNISVMFLEELMAKKHRYSLEGLVVSMA